MTATIQPDDLEALLAAHALGALDGDDLALVEHALATDGNARMELARFARTTQLLDSPGGPRPDVWENIAHAIGAGGERQAVVTPIAAQRRARGARSRFVRAALIAAAVGVALAATAWGVEHVVQSSAPAPTPGVKDDALAATRAKGARRVSLSASDGTSALIVLLPHGLGYVVDGNLPVVVRGSAYRLLGVTDQGNIELAVIGRRIKPTAFELPNRVTALVLERGTSASDQQIASHVVNVPGTGTRAGNTTGGSSSAPTTSPGVKVPTPSLTLPTLPGLLHP